MKKLFKTILLSLILTMLLGTTAFAVEGNGVSGDYRSATGSFKDGCSFAKTGYWIYLVNAEGWDGVSSTNHKLVNLTEPVFVTYGNNTPNLYDTDKFYIFCRTVSDESGDESDVWNYGEPVYTNVPFNLPAITASGAGTGGIVKNWLISPQNGYEAGVLQMIHKYWGKTYVDIFLESWDPENPDKCVYFICEPVIWHGKYEGAEYQGYQITGTTQGMAGFADSHAGELGTGYPFRLFDHYLLPQSYMFSERWLGWNPPNNPADASDMHGSYLTKDVINRHAYGIIAVRPSDLAGDKTVVKSYYSKSGDVETFQRTTISTGSSPYTVANESGYTVTAWQTAKEPKADSVTTTTPYDTAISGTTKVQDSVTKGFTTGSVEMSEDEKTIYIKLVTSGAGKQRYTAYYDSDGTTFQSATNVGTGSINTVQTIVTKGGKKYTLEKWQTSTEAYTGTSDYITAT